MTLANTSLKATVAVHAPSSNPVTGRITRRRLEDSVTMVRDARFTAHIKLAALYAVLIVISLGVQEDDEKAANILRTNLSWTALMAVNVVWLAYHHALLPAGICLLIDALWLWRFFFLMYYNVTYAVLSASKVHVILLVQFYMVNYHGRMTLDEVKRLYRE